MTVINTNVSATLASNAINKNDRAMTTAMERLSTGLRINSASDDAAGLAIAARMRSQVEGLEQAARNANDGISMIQVAEGAYVEVSNMLSRMKEMAVQAASGTYSATDRAALNLEFSQLQSELQRIAGNTQWNGFNILDGSAGGSSSSVNFQVGAGSGQTMTAAFNTLYKSSLFRLQQQIAKHLVQGLLRNMQLILPGQMFRQAISLRLLLQTMGPM